MSQVLLQRGSFLCASSIALSTRSNSFPISSRHFFPVLFNQKLVVERSAMCASSLCPPARQHYDSQLSLDTPQVKPVHTSIFNDRSELHGQSSSQREDADLESNADSLSVQSDTSSFRRQEWAIAKGLQPADKGRHAWLFLIGGKWSRMLVQRV